MIKAEMRSNAKQMMDGTLPLTMNVLEALEDEQDMRQLGFTFYCHRKSIVQALRNELHRQSHRGSEIAAPTPSEGEKCEVCLGVGSLPPECDGGAACKCDDDFNHEHTGCLFCDSTGQRPATAAPNDGDVK